MFAMAQSITVKFTAEDQNGNYFQLDAVKVTSISQNWNQTLAYPDTILILNYIDGIAELPVAEGLLQNKPNPFRGTTEATLTLQEEGQTKIQVVDMAGKVLTECEKTLTQGEHIIKVSLAEPQMALLRVNTPNHDYAVKMLNIAHGGANSIDVSTVTMKEVVQTKAVGAGPFSLGDVLSYVGVKMQGADMVYSNNTVTQAQYSDEVVTFVFDVETPQEPQPPVVVTSEVSDITLATAVCGGEVISDGGAEVTVRGVCWATTQNPTTSDSHTNDGNGLGEFVSDLSNLTAGTTYFVRAYATNSVGTAYGEVKTFTTISVNLPEVITADVSDITSTTAVCGGEVISDGGAEITAHGVCWATTLNPTTSDSHTTDGSGLGEFVSNLTNLTTGTTYYVRAYATNSVGTAYGESKSFTPETSIPEGAINGLFSVSETKQVYFSKGNLQYQASTNTWHFAENQWDYAGSGNSNVSEFYSGWIDLFGWATSGWNNGNMYYQPWNSQDNDNYNMGYGYGPNTNLTNAYANADWGIYNPIINGGNQQSQWRTLTREEWAYVFNSRITLSGIRYVRAKVNNVNGVILLPDDWDPIYFSLNDTNQYNSNYSSNVITVSQWSLLELHGAVFLPAAGCRYGTIVSHVGFVGQYWSTSFYDTAHAYYVYIGDDGLDPQVCNVRKDGLSVRLVRYVE